MWWPAKDECAEHVQGELKPLQNLFEEQLIYSAETEVQWVWGVGSAPSDEGVWRCPLLIFSLEALTHHEVKISHGRYTADKFHEIVSDVPVAADHVSAWDIPRDCLIDVTTRPWPAARVDPTDQVWDRRSGGARHATAGLPCKIREGLTDAFMTAGHVVQGQGEEVAILATGATPNKLIYGKVAYWSDPLGQYNAGFDYAVVTPTDSNDGVNPLLYQELARFPLDQDVAEVEVYTGRRPCDGLINGALNDLGDPRIRRWKNCWMFAPSFALERGDSGSLAMGRAAHEGEVFGHFVGGTFIQGQGMHHQYIQDMASCLNSGLDRHIVFP